MKTLYLLAFSALFVGAFASPLSVHATLDKRAHKYTSGFELDGASTIAFAAIQSTYALNVTNPNWAEQKSGVRASHLFSGGIHLPIPDVGTPMDQAKFFTDNGGIWEKDGMTIPGTLYADQNPSFPYCYGGPPDEVVKWIGLFVDAYHTLNGRLPIIMTSSKWWNTCTGGSSIFGNLGVPLWAIDYSKVDAPSIPTGWKTWTFWRAEGAVAFNKDLYNDVAMPLDQFVN